jgi:multisubunit Na+/H+ antiporter MnhG subunit
MNSQNKLLRIPSVLVLSVGVLLGMALTAIAAWGDFEAVRFDPDLSLLRDASLTTFRCPMIMTTRESGTISATVRNPLERPVTLTVRTDVSNYITLKRENTVRLPLTPGERQRLEWTVTPDDVVYGDLIFVKTLQFRQYPIPGRLGSCGIVVVDIPYLTGGLLVALVFAGSVLSMLGGIGLWLAGQRPLTRRRRQSANTMGALTGSVVAGMIFSLLGVWMLAVIVLALNILLIGAIIGHLMNNSSLSS